MSFKYCFFLSLVKSLEKNRIFEIYLRYELISKMFDKYATKSHFRKFEKVYRVPGKKRCSLV